MSRHCASTFAPARLRSQPVPRARIETAPFGPFRARNTANARNWRVANEMGLQGNELLDSYQKVLSMRTIHESQIPRMQPPAYRPTAQGPYSSAATKYDEDPRGNGVEINVCNHRSAVPRSSMCKPHQIFDAPLGVYVDPDKMIAAHEVGATP